MAGVVQPNGTVTNTNLFVRLVYAIEGVIGALLGMRLILRIFGANPLNGFVNWIYAVSQPLVRPFFGVFNTSLTAQLSQAHLEVPTLIALIVYSLAAWVLVSLLSILG